MCLGDIPGSALQETSTIVNISQEKEIKDSEWKLQGGGCSGCNPGGLGTDSPGGRGLSMVPRDSGGSQPGQESRHGLHPQVGPGWWAQELPQGSEAWVWGSEKPPVQSTTQQTGPQGPAALRL